MNTTKTTQAQKAYEKAQEKFADHIATIISVNDQILDTLIAVSRGLDGADTFSKFNYDAHRWDDVLRKLQATHGKLVGARFFDRLGTYGDELKDKVEKLYTEANAIRLLADRAGDKK